MNTELFFEKLFINAELAEDICKDLYITRHQYSELAAQLDTERQSEIQTIKRVRSLYHNKKGLTEFKFQSFNSFYKWYINQYEAQNGKCYYCKTDENVITSLFEKKFLHRKRTTRGLHLEVERRDSKDNSYNPDNCVLACYFCNNDKSDIFDEHEYLEYLKDRKVFLNSQYEKLNDTK